VIVYLVQGLTLGLSAGASPGPLQFYYLAHAMSNGWRKALPAAAAPLVSDIIIAPVVLLLLTQLPPLFLNVIQVIGALFILYLAWGAYQSWHRGELLDRQAIAGSDAARRGFFKAVGVNFLNPNPYIGWSMITGPIVLRAWAQGPALAAAFVAGFYVSMIALNAVLIILFGRAGDLGPRVARTLLGVSAIALALLGLYQLVMGIERFMQTN